MRVDKSSSIYRLLFTFVWQAWIWAATEQGLEHSGQLGNLLAFGAVASPFLSYFGGSRDSRSDSGLDFLVFFCYAYFSARGLLAVTSGPSTSRRQSMLPASWLS